MHGYGHSDPDVVAGGRGHGHRAHHGVRGCVPPENPAAMAAAIERLAGSPVDRQRLAAAARAAAPCIRGMRLRHRCWAYWSHDAEALAESFPRATATLAL